MSPPGDPRLWTPARYIAHDTRCHLCGADIARTKPGATTGTRGTKAFFNATLGLFECMDCRLEGTRAELAGHELRSPREERCLACAYSRLSSDWAAEHPLFGLTPCAGCELGAGRGLHRCCPRCGHVEHRPHHLQPATDVMPASLQGGTR